MSATTTMIGNLTRDPELHDGGGRPSVHFKLAVTRQWRDGQGAWKKETSFFQCVLWGDAAPNVARSLRKGMRVLAHGRMNQQTFEAPNGAERRSTVEFVVEEIGPSLRFVEVAVREPGASGRAAPSAPPSIEDQLAQVGDEPF